MELCITSTGCSQAEISYCVKDSKWQGFRRRIASATALIWTC